MLLLIATLLRGIMIFESHNLVITSPSQIGVEIKMMGMNIMTEVIPRFYKSFYDSKDN